MRLVNVQDAPAFSPLPFKHQKWLQVQEESDRG